MEPRLHTGRQQEIMADGKVEADYNEAFKVTNCQISLRVFFFFMASEANDWLMKRGKYSFCWLNVDHYNFQCNSCAWNCSNSAMKNRYCCSKIARAIWSPAAWVGAVWFCREHGGVHVPSLSFHHNGLFSGRGAQTEQQSHSEGWRVGCTQE